MPKKHVDGLIAYFKGEQWNNFIKNHLEHPDEEVYHAHLYADSSVHPDSMKKLMFSYFDSIGHPLTRRIDPVSPHPGQAGLHSVYPEGLVHFDMYLRFNGDVVLDAMPPDAKEAEHGSNALSWGKIYQDAYLKDKGYFFKTVGPREEQQIKDYFLGKHWKEMRTHVLNEDVCHCHMNVEISFDPKVLEIYAREALAKMGWTVERIVPCVYDVNGVYTGKLVFLLGNPEEVFDICWIYNPDVTICRAQNGWIFPEAGFDNFMVYPYNEVLKTADFYTLTDEEVAAVAASFKK
jgi:hypothetical protein